MSEQAEQDPADPTPRPLNPRGDLRRWLGRAVAVLSVPALAAWVHLVVSWETVLRPWRELPPGLLGLLVLLMATSALARALRLFDYCHGTVGHAPLVTLRLSLLHNLFNNLLPMRAGEAAFPVLMKRYFGEAYATAAASLLWLRALDLAMLVIVCASVVLLAGAIAGVGRLLVGAALAGMVLGVVLLPQARRLGGRQGTASTTSMPAESPTAPTRINQARRLIARTAQELRATLPDSSTRYVRLVLWSLVIWVTKLLAFLWLVERFVDLSPGQAMTGIAAAELSSVLPVHGLAGAGTYEGAMVGALVLSGAAHEPALVAAVNLHVFVLGVSVLFGLVARLIPVPAAGERPIRDAIG
jgi:hypothetical protein